MATSATAEQAFELREREVEETRQRQLESNVLYYTKHPEEIDRRLWELDREWDVERVTEAEFGLSALVGITLGVFSRKWTLLGALAAGLLAYHAVQGRSPVGLAYRRMGFRTMNEIDQERFALKALRGDFRDLGMEPESDLVEKARKAMRAAY
ncbi:MAG: hypothetical protein NTZ09_15790 [Candidatus Hydrogenedentes bacterium]|nr:hypothetical protein [Candidatus Hydrogenedentota bacterium]